MLGKLGNKKPPEPCFGCQKSLEITDFLPGGRWVIFEAEGLEEGEALPSGINPFLLTPSLVTEKCLKTVNR